MFLCCRVITVFQQQAGIVCDNLSLVSVTDSHRWDAVSTGGNGYLTGAGVNPGVTTGNHPNPKQSGEGNRSTDNTCCSALMQRKPRAVSSQLMICRILVNYF